MSKRKRKREGEGERKSENGGKVLSFLSLAKAFLIISVLRNGCSE